MYIPDNNDLFLRYDAEKERKEAAYIESHSEMESMKDRISDARTLIDDAIDITNDYDAEDNGDLANRLEKIHLILNSAYDKLEV